jgi:hypothetical protein
MTWPVQGPAAYPCVREHAAPRGRGSGSADDKGQIVSQDVRRTPPWARKDAAPADTSSAPATPEETPATADTPVAPPSAGDDVTVGTGSVIALGCIAGTVLLILIGLLFIGLTMLF